MHKKVCCTCKVVVLLIKPIAFLTFSLPSLLSLLKLPAERSKGIPWVLIHWNSCSSHYFIYPGVITTGKIAGSPRHRDLCLRIWDLPAKDSRFEYDDRHRKWHSETQEKCSKSGLTKWAIINGDVLDWYLLDSSPLDLPLLLNVLEYDLWLGWILYCIKNIVC